MSQQWVSIIGTGMIQQSNDSNFAERMPVSLILLASKWPSTCTSTSTLTAFIHEELEQKIGKTKLLVAGASSIASLFI
jgi:hypothetical protein